MTTQQYLDGRRQYQRPQGMLWSDNAGIIVDGYHVPDGYEINSNVDATKDQSFMILSDDNRSEIQFDTDRIEHRERMINGRMRSYHVADKLILSTSWQNLPSRSFSDFPGFSTVTNNNAQIGKPFGFDGIQYTTDGGAGGVQLLDWYEKHTGPFFVYLAYDKYNNFENAVGQYQQLGIYNQVVEMYFADFSYKVKKRGGTNYDFWDVTIKLEEV